MNERDETVQAFARLREHEAGPDADFGDWELEVLSTWGSAVKKRRVDWFRVTFWSAYLFAWGYLAWQVGRWVVR